MVNYNPPKIMLLIVLLIAIPAMSNFYHSDHLGSATWITDGQGLPVQFMHYMPYGELWYDQQASAYNERYKFTGKERDRESGYDYFGARYYSSAVLSWLSVDPLADKYPHISPYAYCAWNPIKYVDPNGKWIETAWDVTNVLMDVTSLVSNIKEGNIGSAIADGVGLILDAGAVAFPFVPAGVGTALKTYRAADKATDAAKLGKAEQLKENIQKGRDFEMKVGEKLGDIKASQVTIETKEGCRTRMDFISIENGELKLTEAKSSAKAPLTPNQKTAFPQIRQNGGMIKGNNGKDMGLPNNTIIPPTKVDIVRPDNF